jgi:hypothetical protein
VSGPGQTVLITPSIIHRLHNDSVQISVPFHIDGKNANFTNRSRIDPEQKMMMPCRPAS